MFRRPSSASVGLPTSPEHSLYDGLHNGHAHSVTPKRPPTKLADTTLRRPSARSASSSQKLDVLANLSDVDPDELFTRHTVSEVKTVQQRLRADADAKQEELRLMVGERYRDLLQASTSILGLAKSSKHVLEALDEMRDTVHAISPVRPPKRAATGEEADKHLHALQSLSAHMKLLLDAPEHLWRLMEKKAYLKAAWLFLLARVVHRALSQEEDDQSWQAYGIDVMDQMPLVQRQWDTITPFRSQISHRATLSLREATSSPGEVCATLLTLHLLESRPLPETLVIYLAQRTKTLSSMLTRNASTSANGNAKSNGKGLHRPRKVAVRETKQKAQAVLDAISRTVSTARTTFADGNSPSLMKLALQFFQTPTDNPETLPPELQLTTQTLLTSLPSSSHFALLPQSIRTYKPYIDGAAVTTLTLLPQLRDRLESWFKKAVQDARGAVTDWFSDLSSVREVWEVRNTLLAWLDATEGLESLERLQLQLFINEACQHRATSVWNGALDGLDSSFRNVIASATTAVESEPGMHPYDVQPIEHLFHPPSLPTMLQSSAHSNTAAAQFMKYKSSLRQQLNGRTPLLEKILSTLECHASELHQDLATMLTSDRSSSDVIERMSSSYRADAEALGEKICDVLDHAAANEGSSDESSPRLGSSSTRSVLVARVCQELASSSDFFVRVGCGPTSVEAFRQRLSSLHLKLMEGWQENTVARIFEDYIGGRMAQDSARDSVVSSIPSPTLLQALLSLSSEMQRLGVCLEDDRRQEQAGSALRRFITTYLDRLPSGPATLPSTDLQQLRDLAFLQRLQQYWGDDNAGLSDHIDQCISQRREVLTDHNAPPQSDLINITRDYLSRTQILLAGLLPSHPLRGSQHTPPPKAEKPSTLLLYGTPSVEQRFEPALELIKPPQRFGLLLVGGATIR
ncbi:hypothetical protein L227DRAFT_509454 [Lentinus tigrinus ALCF2SS1-6]|uniref:Conserved oligomeric Golgi complex subunit 1 n=1 Tax=Lentinus tigrinus ALCF2SS1-6 TaxID=1328759 RepID=A0A5C2RY11_9APHY|nr:hypothetical protein L227DRAFT_509454 [Lentinus tigrinus ALCF2SS1-6]